MDASINSASKRFIRGGLYYSQTNIYRGSKVLLAGFQLDDKKVQNGHDGTIGPINCEIPVVGQKKNQMKFPLTKIGM